MQCQNISDLGTLKITKCVKKLEERLEDKISPMQQIPSRRLLRKLAKATTEFAYIASKIVAYQRIRSIYVKVSLATTGNRSRKASKLTGIVHFSQVDRMERILNRGEDLEALMKLRPVLEKREDMPELRGFAKLRATSSKDSVASCICQIKLLHFALIKFLLNSFPLVG